MRSGDNSSDSEHRYRSQTGQEKHPVQKRRRKRKTSSSESSDSESDEGPIKIRRRSSRREPKRDNWEEMVNKKVHEILSNSQVIAQATPNPLTANFVAKNDIVPLFDPEKSNLTAANWLHKIEQLADIHKWDDTTKSYFMQSKLTGIAKIWYNSLHDYSKSWQEWKQAVSEAFPSHEYFIDNIKKMVERKKNKNETMMHYFYSKCILVRKCEISDVNAVSCIIDGLPLSLQGAAKSGNYNTPEELFQGFLSKIEYDIGTEKEKEKTPVYHERVVNHRRHPEIICFNCKKPGHAAKKCWYRSENADTSSVPSTSKNTPNYEKKHPTMARRPTKTCSNCGKIGHLREDCWFLKPATVKILQRQVINDTYYIKVKINNVECQGYLDTGSQINVAQAKLVEKLGIKINTADTYICGFGNNVVYPKGQAQLTLHFDNFSVDTIIYFVNIEMGLIDVIIGQPVINNNQVEIQISGQELTIKK